MKSLFKTTEETPITSTIVIVITLLAGISDYIFNISPLIGWSENLVGIIVHSISFVTFVLNLLINNEKIQPLNVYLKKIVK